MLTRDGYTKRMEELEKEWQRTRFACFELNAHVPSSAGATLFMSRDESTLLEIETETGRKIKVTEDHPMLTANGFKEAKKLSIGETLAVYPFEGVDYEKPESITLISEEEIKSRQVRKVLKEKGLLPLSLAHEKIGAIARILGYAFGDAHIQVYFDKKKSGRKVRKIRTVFYGEKAGLEELRKDVILLGFRPSRIRTRKRIIKGKNSVGEENSFSVNSTSFSTMLIKLGVPAGDKTKKEYSVPEWIKKAPLWIKRNFLAGLFGAELTTPKVLKNGYNFAQLALPVGKEKTLEKSARRFLKDIARLLKEFGVNASYIYRAQESESKVVLKLLISNKEENLVKLFTRIGYEYNFKRHFLACVAAEYLLKKRPYKSELKNRSKKPSFAKFPEFLEKCVRIFKKSGMVPEKIVRIRRINSPTKVYDFTLAHKDHNFVANSFVVHNCGVRLVRTDLTLNEVKPKIRELVDTMFRNVPSGVGSRGLVKVKTQSELDRVLELGAKWAVENGYGVEEDLEVLEENGCMRTADPGKVSSGAKKRGMPQLGSLGSGNHFLEVQVVDQIYNPEVAKAFGIEQENQICVMIHTGSRGLGHQVCSDYLREMERRYKHLVKNLPDRELIYAPARSEVAANYFAAMSAAANFAWCNRQMIVHWVRESFEQVFGEDWEELGMRIVYDVAHNIAKLEEHEIDGKRVKVYVHRKGATRAFPPGHRDIPKKYQNVGQPILIPGSMGTASYVLVGSERAMKETFGSTAHGAGREMSRSRALREFRGSEVAKRLEKQGIYVHGASWKGIAEEAPQVYKDIDEVVKASHQAGIGLLVARLRPLGVVKG